MKGISSGFKALAFSAVLLGGILPGAIAQTKKSAPAVTYKAHCGMIYSAADAKKNHYICPMDHKPLVKMTAAAKPKKGAKGSMSGMKI